MNPIKLTENGKLIVFDAVGKQLLNKQGLRLYNNLDLLYNTDRYPIWKKLLADCDIYITSQDRGWGEHINGKAVDLVVLSPLYNEPEYKSYFQQFFEYVWNIPKLNTPYFQHSKAILLMYYLQNKDNKIFLSQYDWHLHYAYEEKNGYKGAEILYKNGIRFYGGGVIGATENDKIEVEFLKPEHIYYFLVLCQAHPDSITTKGILQAINLNINDYSNYFYNIYPTIFQKFKEKTKEIIAEAKKIMPLIFISAGIFFLIKIFPLIKNIKDNKK